MLKIEWNIALGVKEMDAQHQRLIDIMNDMVDSINTGVDTMAIQKAVNELVDYSLIHLRTEERYFSQFKYENMEEHIVEHAKFERKILEFQKRLSENCNVIAEEIIGYIEKWLTGHVLTYDKAYIECFHKNGIY